MVAELGKDIRLSAIGHLSRRFRDKNGVHRWPALISETLTRLASLEQLVEKASGIESQMLGVTPNLGVA